MFAHHIESGFLHLPDIKDHRFIRGRCIQPVRPVSLIQDTVLELYLSVQTDTRNSFFIFLHGKTAHCKIAFDGILPHPHCKKIEPGFLTGPESRIRDLGLDHTVRVSLHCVDHFRGCRSFRSLPFLRTDHRTPDLDFHRTVSLRLHRDPHTPLFQIRDRLDPVDMIFGDFLHPDRLPDPALGRVKHSSRF